MKFGTQTRWRRGGTVARLLVIALPFLLALGLVHPAQTAGLVTQEWVRSYNGTGNSRDVGMAIATDAGGNVYVTGYSTGSTTSLDYTTVKYDTSGNELWMSHYNGPANAQDIARALALDAEGNVYVTGSSDGTGTSTDYATVKYDASGNELWVRRYNGPGNGSDVAVSIAADPSGNVHITGSSLGNGNDYATLKYDANGNQLWIQRYNGPGNSADEARVVTLDNGGNVYVTGKSIGSGTSWDYATLKYDSSGNQLWVQRYNGPVNDQDSAVSLALDMNGNLYVTGESWGNGTSLDYATVKYDANGSQLWVQRYNGPAGSYDQPAALATDASGNVYVTGGSYANGASEYATLKYDPSGSQVWLQRNAGPSFFDDLAFALKVDDQSNVYVTGRSAGNGTGDDWLTLKYDTAGNELWAQRYNGPSSYGDVAIGIALDGSGNVYIAGYSDTASFTPDYLVIKYSQQPPNRAPVANAGGPYVASCSGASVTVNAGASSDPDAAYGDSIVQYEWFLGTISPANSLGRSSAFTRNVTAPAQGAQVTLWLQVTDRQGLTGTASTTLRTEDTTPPLVTPPADKTIVHDRGTPSAANVAIGVATTSDNCGTASVNGTRNDGSALSVPFPLGVTTITWTATDTVGNSSSGQQRVTVTNAAPVASDQSWSCSEDGGRQRDLDYDSAGNYADPDFDPLTAIIVTPPSHGHLSFTPTIPAGPGYIPDPDFHGTDTFTYRLSDGIAQSNLATVTITVEPVNDAPIAQTNSYSGWKGCRLKVTSPGVLGNDTDVEGDALTAVVVRPPTGGILVLNANGSFAYLPNAGTTTDTFTYRSFDGVAYSEPATVTLTVAADTAPPTCVVGAVVPESPSRVYMPLTVADGQSGVAEVKLTGNSTNCYLEWDSSTGRVTAPIGTPLSFDPTQSSTVVRVVKINPSLRSKVEVVVTDCAGRSTMTDPVFASLEVGKLGRVERLFSQVPAEEHYLLLQNGRPGISAVQIWVNGRQIYRGTLTSGQMLQLDLASAMRPGNHNKVRVVVVGPRGSNAVLTLGDSTISGGQGGGPTRGGSAGHTVNVEFAP